jgi:hypothetical protein
MNLICQLASTCRSTGENSASVPPKGTSTSPPELTSTLPNQTGNSPSFRRLRPSYLAKRSSANPEIDFAGQLVLLSRNPLYATGVEALE